MKNYKPDNYNSLSPYLIVDNTQKLVDLLKIIFDATELRRLDNTKCSDGTFFEQLWWRQQPWFSRRGPVSTFHNKINNATICNAHLSES